MILKIPLFCILRTAVLTKFATAPPFPKLGLLRCCDKIRKAPILADRSAVAPIKKKEFFKKKEEKVYYCSVLFFFLIILSLFFRFSLSPSLSHLACPSSSLAFYSSSRSLFASFLLSHVPCSLSLMDKILSNASSS